MADVQRIPEGHGGVSPYLNLVRAADAVEYYKAAFGGEVVRRELFPDGAVMHAEVRIGGSIVMVSEARREPAAVGVLLNMCVRDVDAVFRQALALVVTEVMPLTDKPWGDRMGSLKDPFGVTWSLASHVEDVSSEEMQRRMAAMTPPA